jgi:hypothetical protein
LEFGDDMTINQVTVTIAAQGSPLDALPPQGNFVFSPNGVMWPGTAGSLPIDPSIQHGFLVLGTASVQLVASDNFSAGVLNWDCIINIRGLMTINAPSLTINFATGPTQSIWDILSSNGYVLTTQP